MIGTNRKEVNPLVCIGEMHLIVGIKNIICDCFELSRGAFYSSIGINGTIGTNRIAVNPLVFHW